MSSVPLREKHTSWSVRLPGIPSSVPNFTDGLHLEPLDEIGSSRGIMELTAYGSARLPGIVHKCDSLIVRDNLTSEFMMPFNKTKCPGCRDPKELLCPSCIYSHFININRLKERYKKLYHKKSKLCDDIKKEIQSQLNVQSDIHRLQKTIVEKHNMIEKKKDRISRINGHINIVNLNLPKAKLNVETLEKKINMHLMRISSTTDENKAQKEKVNTSEMKNGQTDNDRQIGFWITKKILEKLKDVDPNAPFYDHNFLDSSKNDFVNLDLASYQRKVVLQTVNKCLEDRLIAERLVLAANLVKLFPLQEIEKMNGAFAEELRIQSQLEEASSSDIKKWDAQRIINPSKRPSTKFFKICHCEISDNCEYNLLGNELCTGSLILTNRSAHAFAAFVYLCHFVNISATIFDVILPYKITLHELCTCDKWTKELFETDVFKINVNVLQLCCSLGLPSNEIDFKRPFANIMAALSMIQKRPHQKMPVTFLMEKLSEPLRRALSEFRWEERRQELDISPLEDDWVKIGL